MNCPQCGGAMTLRREDHVYRESGLSSVVLLGIGVQQCPRQDCGEKVFSIPRILPLHRLIAFRLATQPGRLRGEEIRFLRKHLGWTGTEFAQVLDVDKATVSRWENGKDRMGPMAERLVRLFILRDVPSDEFPTEKLAGVAQDDAPALQLCLRMMRRGWSVEAERRARSRTGRQPPSPPRLRQRGKGRSLPA